MIYLMPIDKVPTGIDILYQLLKERTPEQSISHKEMPTLQQHIDFVESKPYMVWRLIQDDDEIVGSIYLTRQREIGITIFKHQARNGYGEQAIKLLMETYPGKFLANISPSNTSSIRFFESLGATLIQKTYSL